MPGPVAGSDAVVVLSDGGTVRGDQHGAERLIALLQRLGREFHAATQVPHLILRGHSRSN